MKALINSIYQVRKKIEVYNEDAEIFIPKVDKKYNNIFFNFDPPYVKAGPQLYKNSYKKENHLSLSLVIQSVKNKWILTYDDNELVQPIKAIIIENQNRLKSYIN